MNNFIRSVKSASEFKKNLALLISGNGIAQILPIIAYPILTRIYEPSSFGVFAVFASVHNIILTVSSGKFDSTLILPKEKKEAENLFNIGLSIALGISVFIPFFVFITEQVFTFSKEIEGIWLWFYFLVITVPMGSLAVLINSWCTRTKKFRLVFQYILVLNMLTPSLKIILGVFHIENGLLIAYIIAQVAASAFFIAQTKKGGGLPKIRLFKKYFAASFKAYQNFPKYQAPKTLLNTFSGSLPVFLLTSFFSSNVTGLFSLALTLLLKPIHIYNNSSYQVLSQKIVELKAEGKALWPVIKKFLTRTFLLYLAPAIALAFVAPTIFKVLLGEEWAAAGKFCQVMLPWSAFVLMGGSVAFIPTVFLEQAKELVVDVVYIFVRIIALTIGLLYKDPVMAVALFGFAGVFVISYQLLWYRKLLLNWDANLNKK